MTKPKRIAILGTGTMGRALALGLLRSGEATAGELVFSRSCQPPQPSSRAAATTDAALMGPPLENPAAHEHRRVTDPEDRS